MKFHTERDSRGIDHLVDERGRCATFRDCHHDNPEARARQALADYSDSPYKAEDFIDPEGAPLTRDDVEFMRSRNRDHTIKMAPKLAVALLELLDERLTLQAKAWDSGYQDGALYGIGPLEIENPYTKEEQQ
jgi:hypothetical protein